MDEKFKYWTRRILAFAVVVPTIGIFCWVLIFYAYEPAFTALNTLTAGVIGFYFGARTASK